MLDTLMVLWTRGICNRLMQTLATFLCLFTAICVLLFLVTASGVKWPGLAVSVTPATTASTPAASPTATPAPTAPAYLGLPPILQNPTPRPYGHRIIPPVIATPGDEPTEPPDTPSNPYGGYQTLFP